MHDRQLEDATSNLEIDIFDQCQVSNKHPFLLDVSLRK